jgi:cytochrome c oxidase subunit IV
MNHEEQVEHTSHSYSKYFLIWLGLLILTAITVTVAGINLGEVTIAVAIIIATIKSYLVLTVFMHLETESKVFKIFLMAALFFIIISLVLLFSDYSSTTI